MARLYELLSGASVCQSSCIAPTICRTSALRSVNRKHDNNPCLWILPSKYLVIFTFPQGIYLDSRKMG